MKICGLLFLGLSAILVLGTTTAGDVATETDRGLIENKLLNEVEASSSVSSEIEKEEDHQQVTVDDGNTTENQYFIRGSQESSQDLIAEEDVDAFKQQPGMHRLARRLRSFHNRRILNLNNNFPQIQHFGREDKQVDDFLANERAVNIRKRSQASYKWRNRRLGTRRKAFKRNAKNKNSARRRNSRITSKRHKSRAKKGRRSKKRNGQTRRHPNRKKVYNGVNKLLK